jgi:RHS repeat-associated protein
VTTAAGEAAGMMKYFPFGESRNSTGTIATDRLFTGQRLDDTGLYYYGARYYDPQIGRFISPDTIVPNPANPQSLNRYSYCLNNPLKYTDPTGHQYEDDGYYEALCEEYGYNSSAGYAFFFSGGEMIGTVNVNTFVAWVDESPELFDYISSERDSSSWVNQALNGNNYYYHSNLTSESIILDIGLPIDYSTKYISPSENNNIQWDKVFGGLVIIYGASQTGEAAAVGLIFSGIYVPEALGVTAPAV